MSDARLEQLLAEAGLAPADRAELGALLAPLADPAGEAPRPSAELAALFGETSEDAVDAPVHDLRDHRRWRVRSAAVGAAVLAVASVGATGLSAAANSLPSGLQHQVSQFSRHYLPFDFPEPEKPAQPLGQGRFPLAAGTSLPRGDGDLVAPSRGVDPPRILVSGGRPSQAGPYFLAPASPGPTQHVIRAQGYHQYAVPSATPSPSAAASPSATPSPSADEQAGRPGAPSSSTSPTPSSGPTHPDHGSGHGQPGGHKPGKGEDPSPGQRPGKTPAKGPIKGPGSIPGAGSGPGAGQGGTPTPGAGGGVPAAPTPPPTPEPSTVVPDLPGLGGLPDLPFVP